MQLFVRWRVHREANLRAKEDCIQEIRQIVSERIKELGRDSMINDRIIREVARQLYKLKKQAKDYSLVCSTRADIESRWKSDSKARPHIRTWGPVIDLPASKETCSTCGGFCYHYGGAGGSEWRCSACSGVGTVTIDNSYYLAIAETT